MLAGSSRFRVPGRLVGRSCKLRIASSPSAPRRDSQSFPDVREIFEQFMLRLPENLGSRRNLNGYIFTVFSVALVSFSMTTPLCFEDTLILEMKESIDTIGTLNIDVSSSPAIPATGATSRHRLFSSKSETPISPVSGNYLYFCVINKQWRNSVDYFENDSNKEQVAPGFSPVN